jgi:hypothetical protein
MDRRAPIATLAQVSSIVDNPILPLPERSCNLKPHGIGQLPEQTHRNTHIGNDKLKLFPRDARISRVSVYRALSSNL